MEEMENVILVKASIRRKKSQSDNIKYSGFRPIRRFSTGARTQTELSTLGEMGKNPGIKIRPAEFSVPALPLASRVAFQKLIHFSKPCFLHFKIDLHIG